MRLLLDTHAFVWWQADDPRLSATARDAVADPAAVVFVSAATAWELAMKRAKGHGLTLVSKDEAFVPYGVPTPW